MGDIRAVWAVSAASSLAPPTLDRFVEAQQESYPMALCEIRAGLKRNHWMWYIFPQLAGLGHSEAARYYAIDGLGEARAYLAHVVLGPRLIECTHAMLCWTGRDLAAIVGQVDALKFRSSMTLFEASGGDECFALALDCLCGSQRDAQTLALLKESGHITAR